jgi:N-acetyl-anhydromuramyl-L-alanine amidase AmpD
LGVLKGIFVKKVSRRSFGKLVVGLGTSVLVGGLELRLAPGALAAVATPGITGCATWGAAAARNPIQVLSQKPTGIIVHNTQNPNSSDFSQAYAYQTARAIQAYHQNTKGWDDSGQHFTIFRGGQTLEGRHRSVEAVTGGTTHVQGAHCEGFNDVFVGIEVDGSYGTAAPPQGQYDKLVALCAYICQQYGLSGSAIYGHRDYNNTDCPGDTLYSMLPQLRLNVQAALGTVGRTWPVVARGSTATALVKTVQYLLNARGASLTADGAFGPGTETAVRSFQTSRGIAPVDGIVGANTWEALVLTVRRGDSGEAVKGAQNQLKAKGYAVTVDGAFGPGTETAVKSFQHSQSQTEDGIVGVNTWNRLVK